MTVRVRKQQGELFGGGSTVKHFAVMSNFQEWSTAKLLHWHRKKAGTHGPERADFKLRIRI